jgi:hypothetical protein
MGMAVAALVRGEAIPAHVAGFGLTEAMLSPSRPALAPALSRERERERFS